RACWHVELINPVVIGHVNASAGHHAAVPFARAGHLVGAGVNHCTCIAIVTVQLTVALGANHPNDRVIGAIGRGDPWRALAALARVPSGDYVRRTGRSNLVGLNLAASVSAKNKISSLRSRVSGRRLTSHSAINACRGDRPGNATQVVTVDQISIAVLTQGKN